MLALGIAVVGIAAVGACTTVPGGGAIPVAAPTSATAEHRAVSPLDEPTGSVTSSSASTRASSTAPPTVTVTSVPPTTKPKTTAKSTPKTTTTTKAKPKPTQTPTPKATATPKPTATKSTATTAPTAPKTPATGPTVSGCGNPNPGKVLLTFDDGGPKAAAILAILDRYRIKARWFPTGQWANANGAMIQRLIADGQMLGNHTYSHPQIE